MSKKRYEVCITSAGGHVSTARFVEESNAMEAMADAIRMRQMGVTDTETVYVRELERNIVINFKKFI